MDEGICYNMEEIADFEAFIKKYSFSQIKVLRKNLDENASQEIKSMLDKCLKEYPKPHGSSLDVYKKQEQKIKVSGATPCHICGTSELFRSGTCFTCVNGHSTGCS